MDISRILGLLREELAQLNEAIIALERVQEDDQRQEARAAATVVD